MLEHYRQYGIKRQNTGKYRQLPESPSIGLAPLLDFSSNDYLSLSQRKEVLSAAIQAGERDGTGSTGSRLLSGNKPGFTALESRIASDKGTESALVFNSGFQANMTVLSSLLDVRVLNAKPIVFFDRLNHASLYQAVFLSGAELVRYRHLDCSHLAECLTQFSHDPRPKFIVTETLFGMDGDILPLQNILELAREHRAFLYLDEAHAVGILGKRGYGLSTTIDYDVPCMVMGTLSKAVGCAGAYVACDAFLKDYLINKAEGFIYSTASSPMVIGAALKAWEMIPMFDDERKTLFALADDLRERLLSLGFNTSSSVSHIIPIIVGHQDKLTQMNHHLLSAGIVTSFVRAPTVPANAERLRLALNVGHTEQDVDRFIGVLQA